MDNSTSTNNEITIWFHDAIKKGLVLGMIHILVFLVLFVLAPSKVTGFAYLTFVIIFNLGYVIYFGIQWRREVGGYIEYGEAFRYLFVLFLANGVLQIAFTLVMVLANPTYPETMAQSQFDTSIYWAERFGAPPAAIEKMQEDFNMEDAKKNMGFRSVWMGLIIGPIVYAISCSILALIVRKNRPDSVI